MLIYHLANIDVISKLSCIHYFHTFMPQYDNIHLFNWSETLYNDTKGQRDVHYIIGEFVMGKIGDFIFMNYSRYEYCHLLYSANKKDQFLYHYKQLPISYRWLLKEEYQELIDQ